MQIRSLLAIAAAIAPFTAHAADIPGVAWSAPAAVTDRIIVKYRSGEGAFPTVHARMAATVAANRQGVEMNHVRGMANGAQVFRLSRSLTTEQIKTMAAGFSAGDSNVEYAEPDRILRPMYVPNDSLYSNQWSLFDSTGGIRAPAAWDKATGLGVTVAVIDTGVRPHADLVANLLPGYNFISDAFVSGSGGRSNDATDPGDAVGANYCGSGTGAHNSSWHGTHVAGIVAAIAGNGAGVAGVAFKAKVLPLRVLGRCGGYTSDIADAIVWAAGGTVAGVPTNPNPAKVINMSLGGDGLCDVTTQAAISNARARGTVVVVAAGNDNADASTTSPANCTGVIAVAATGKTGGKASYSNFGSNVTLAAPGGDRDAPILSTLNLGTTTPGADSYAGYMGTSMATPVVSGVVALMLSVNQTLTPDQIAAMLKTSARAFPATCTKCGVGIVDAAAAVALAAAAGAPIVVAPGPTPVTGNDTNHTLGSAQFVATLPALVSASISSFSASDFYKVTVGGRAKLSATLTPGATAGLGLGVYTTSGQLLFSMPGIVGKPRQLQITNQGSKAAPVIVRVFRSTGSTGAYTLLLGS